MQQRSRAADAAAVAAAQQSRAAAAQQQQQQCINLIRTVFVRADCIQEDQILQGYFPI